MAHVKKTPTDPTIADVEIYASRLPPVELTIARMRLRGKVQKDGTIKPTQKEIGALLHMTQPGVNLRLRKLRKRLEILRKLPNLQPGNFARDLGRHFTSAELEMMADYWNGGTFRRLGQLYKMEYKEASLRIRVMVERLRDLATARPGDKTFSRYANAFVELRKHQNFLWSPNYAEHARVGRVQTRH